ncbi:MAG TPA: SRPBCC family protein [Chitinophagaceae bacterium]|nr:SRPBCC family protein [Chitinophagaceae bacterium]
MIVLYIVLGLIGLLLLAGLFISKDLQANKEIVINKPVDEVFGFIKYLKNQQLYSKWAALDADMKNEYNGIDGQPGFVNHWVGNKKVGEGEQEITAIEEGKAIYTDLRFIKPFKSFAKVKMTAEAIDANSTKVSWGFQSKMNYPMNIMKLFMNMNEMIGKDFSTGLANLKNLLEK